MAIEIVDFPINSMVIFNSYVKLPEGTVGSCWEENRSINQFIGQQLAKVDYKPSHINPSYSSCLYNVRPPSDVNVSLKSP